MHQHANHFLNHIRPGLTAGGPDSSSDNPAGGSSRYDPCVSSSVSHYLNRPEVQSAIHANTTGSLHYPWSDCSSIVHYSRFDLLTSVLPIYRELLTSGIRMLVFSGDVDGIVPVTGTRSWLNKLDLKTNKSWRPWFAAGQVGGYIVEYEGLTFATVRNAGHMVWKNPAVCFSTFTVLTCCCNPIVQ
ncbi:SCPL25, partial [Symbiodinium sp. KB8]